MYQGHFYTDAISRQKENIFKTQTLRISCHLTKNGGKQVFVHILAGERVFLFGGQQIQMFVGQQIQMLSGQILDCQYTHL